MQEGGAGAVEALPVLCQSAAAIQPGDGTLDDRSSRQDDKAAGSSSRNSRENVSWLGRPPGSARKSRNSASRSRAKSAKSTQLSAPLLFGVGSWCRSARHAFDRTACVGVTPRRRFTRVAVGAEMERGRQTSTIEDARALLPDPTMRFPSSVRMGHVPLIPNPARTTASRKVSHPVEAVPSLRSVSDCLNA